MPKQTKRVGLVREHERKILVVFSDTHAGSQKGLANPETMLYEDVPVVGEDGDAHIETLPVPIQTNAFQRWLFNDVFKRHVGETFDFADGDEMGIVHDGDMAQGVKYRDDLAQDDQVSQNFVATANMLPWFEYPNLRFFRFIQGTNSHDNKAPESVCRALQKEYPETDMRVVKHSLLHYGGATFDIAHHGAGPGGRNWLQGNEVRYYTKSLNADYVDAGKRPPDAVVRAHFHTRIEEWITKFYPQWGRVRTAAIITPSYQGMNEYARQKTRSQGYTLNGHVAFEIVDGKIKDLQWFTTGLDMKTEEVFR